jgi:predicted dehydrogenase
MNPVRVALIGTGGIAGAHLDAYSRVKEAEVVAVCDIVP